jgi:hypothetical protein
MMTLRFVAGMRDAGARYANSPLGLASNGALREPVFDLRPAVVAPGQLMPR